MLKKEIYQNKMFEIAQESLQTVSVIDVYFSSLALSQYRMSARKSALIVQHMYVLRMTERIIKNASWPDAATVSNFRKKLNALHIFLVISLITLTIGQVIMYIITNPLNPIVVADILSAECVLFHVIIKVIMYNVHRGKLIKLMKSVKDSLESNVEPLVNYVEIYMKLGIIIYGSYSLSVLFLISDYIIAPFFQQEIVLPALMWYPFDYTNSTLFYGLAYVHQIMAIQLSAYTVGVEITFGMLVLHCCAQFKYLQYLLQTLTLDCHGKPSRGTIRLRIAHYVDYQNEVLRSINDINDIHTYIVLVLFCTATITVCCLGFRLTVEALSIDLLAKLMLNAGCILLQLLLYYLPADILNTEAMNVELAVYSCNWESLLANQRRDILFIFMRSMQVPRLTSGRISDLHLDNYVKFLTTTASYLTTLQAVAGTS